MVRMVILRYAQEQGHTVITSALVDQATVRFCPGRGKANGSGDGLPWTDEAKTLIEFCGDASAAADIRLRAEKRARRDGAATALPPLQDEARPARDRSEQSGPGAVTPHPARRRPRRSGPGQLS